MSVLTESEDEDDLHQCGRCRAMFRRLADYLAHKRHKLCRRLQDSAAQTSPTHHTSDVETADWQTSDDREDVDVARVVRESLETSVSDADRLIDNHCSLLALPVCDDVAATDSVVVALPDTTNDVSSDAGRDDDVAVADCTSSIDQEAQPQQHGDVDEVALPQAPPPHQCPQCDFTSKFRDDYDQHLRRQHGLSSHVCVDCARAFTDAYKLRRHQREYCTKTPTRKRRNARPSAVEPHHQLAPRFLALDARKKTADDGGGGANETPFRCHMCTESFVDYDGVRSHVAARHSAIARPGICRFCGAWFANPYKLRRHVSSSVHDDVPTDVLSSFKRQIDRMAISCTPEAVRLLRRARAERRQQQMAALGSGNECALCGRTFSARSALIRHRKVVHGRRSAAAGGDAAPTISCQLCGASFDRRRAYLRHRRDEHRKLPVVREPPAARNCPVCERKFKRADAAVRHHAAMHAARQQLPDDALAQSLSFDVDDLLFTGAELDSTATHACFVCAQPSPTRADQVRHLELFHRVWVPLPDGPVPSTLFDDIPAIPPSLRHIDDALAATQTQHIGTSKSPSPQSDDPRQQILLDRPAAPSRPDCGSSISSRCTCPYCRQPFGTLDALYRHKVDYHRLDAVFRCVQASCRATFPTLADYERHATSFEHSQAAFVCSSCNEHFADLLSLLSHRVSAHRRRPRLSADVGVNGPPSTSKQSGPILCDQCGRTFSKRSALMRHRSVVHRRESCRRYACTQCDRRFVKREHLQRHVVSRHATARPYVCRAAGCGKAFKRKDKLQEHYRCHSTDRLYACSLCGRSYRQRYGLRNHERTHRRPAVTKTDRPERRRSCRRCPATFTRAGKLAEHLRTVHGRGAGKDVYAHRCDLCGKTFPRPERMRRHAEREHNVAADWSHRCAVCGKGFAGLRSYDVHMARHHVDASGPARVDSGSSRCRRRTQAKPATTEPSPPVVVVTGRHPSSVTASCDVRRAAAADERQTDVVSPTSPCFNRFFVPSTLSGRHQQLEPTSLTSSLSRIDAQSTSLPCRSAHCPPSDDNISAHRRLSFEPLPYLHHPTRANNDYSYYTSGYHHHPAATHRTQFGLYPSAPTGFGYASTSAAACGAARRPCSLFPADPAAAAAALPFGVQSADSCFGGQSVERRPADLGSGLATAFPSVMAADYGGAGGSSAPLRPLATQPPAAAANTYYPVPDPPSVGRWFDSVPTLLPPPVDASSLDAVRWPPRPCIDSLPVRPRYPFGMEPTSRGNSHQSTMSRSTYETAASVAGPSWSSVERSCLLNCNRVDSAGGSGLVLGSRRAVDGNRGVDAGSLYGGAAGGHRNAGGGVPAHGMLSLLPPW